MTLAPFLLKRGWLPAPSTKGPAWQHPRLSCVPHQVTDDCGMYGDGEARFSLDAAIAVQCVYDAYREPGRQLREVVKRAWREEEHLYAAP